MLARLTLTYHASQGLTQPWPSAIKPSLGSIFHALFLEDMATRNPLLFEHLHTRENHLRPYKLTWPEYHAPHAEMPAAFTWSINALTPELSDYLAQWAAEPTQTLHIKQLESSLHCHNHQLDKALTYGDFAQQYYNPGFVPPERVTLVFNSPTTFNWAANNHYYPMPDPRLILSSLYTKWNTFSQQLTLEDEDILDHFIAAIRIRQMAVKSTVAMVGRHGIPCFRGELGLTITRKTPQALRQLLMLLLHYAPYCGVGAKTAMGLGTVDIIE